MTDDFAAQYLNEASTLEMPLEDRLALWYHVRCEMFDRVVCQARDPFGDARPVMSWEISAVQKNAYEVLHQLLAAYPALPPGRLAYAIRKYGQRYTTEQMERMLDKLTKPATCACQTDEHLTLYVTTKMWSCPCRCPEHADAHLVFRRTS